MLSWIFRNRQRLSKIYGPASAPPLAGARFAPAGAGARDDLPVAGPGSFWSTRRFVWVRPMPRRATGAVGGS